MENGPGLKMYFLLKNGDIPACYVRLPEGIPFFFGGGELFAALFKAKITRFTPPEDNAWEKAEHVFPLSFFFYGWYAYEL